MGEVVTINNKIIKAEPLTIDGFKPYGDVIHTCNAEKVYNINEGNTQRFHNLADIDVSTGDGYSLVNIFRSSPLKHPIKIKMMERHPKSSQAFYPLSDNPYLVVVAKAGEFDINTLKVFIAQSNQGVNYHKGTWHHYSLALNDVSDFLVIDRGTKIKGDPNCDEITLPESQQFTISY